MSRFPIGVALMAYLLATAQVQAGDAPNSLGEGDPRLNPASVITAGKARFTLLTHALVRLEWSEKGIFEDRATYAFINRHLPAVQHTEELDAAGRTVIKTDELTIVYDPELGKFSQENLSITLTKFSPSVTWRPGVEDTGNLLSTVRTLDGVSGSIPLPPGILSRSGWSLVDESGKWIFDNSDLPWAAERSDTEALDWYFFGYGHDYTRALKDFTRVSGSIPLPPRYVLGTWWSRYWAYTEQEFRELVAGYHEHDVPLDILVVDMDWHLDGWTGYTWNPVYFPDPAGFLKWVKSEGLRTTLNLHPHNGVGRHEAAFPEMAEAMGLDPATAEGVPFEVWNRRYMDAYFKHLHHPLEKIGVDFWWMDWQQGSDSGLEGLDPLTWLNYLHWSDWERNPDRSSERPLVFSRWGGLGNHRYQIGFSGDTYCDWKSLAFQPYFTATAGNVGYAWWSHDIGGHQPGRVDPEVYTRWIQWGALSPALRTHTTKNAEAERRIWAFDEEFFVAARDAFRLRYALAPYIYTAGRQTYDSALPLVRPLYYSWPELDAAYEATGQYLFGDDLLVAPVVGPRDPLSRRADISVWFPPGEWVHWFTGESFTGPSTSVLSVPLEEIPLFVRAGGIIPTTTKRNRLGDAPFEAIELNVFPGTAASGSMRLYEDDSVGRGYQGDAFAWTAARWERGEKSLLVTIDPSVGEYPGQLAERDYVVVVRDVWAPSQIRLNGVPKSEGWSYDTEKLELRVPVENLGVRAGAKVAIVFDDAAMDRGLLLAGARGRTQSIRRAAARYGLPLPSIKAASHPEAIRALLDWNWAEALFAALDAKTDREELAGALAELAGIRANTVIESDPSDPNAIAIATSLSVSTKLLGLSARIEYIVAGPWKIAGPATIDIPRFGEIGEFLHTAKAEAGGEHLPSGDVQVRYVFIWKGEELSTRQSFSLFPSIPGWQIVGPFDNPANVSLDTVFPPEQEVDLAATYEGVGEEEIAWREVSATPGPSFGVSDDFLVKLHDVFGEHNEDAVAYAAVWVDSETAQEASLAIGSDDGVAVWLNGVEVHRNAIGRPYAPRQDRVPIQLIAGRNQLLLKISQGTGGWEFCAWIENAERKPLRGITYQLNP